MSFVTTILDAAGGYGRGRDAAFQRGLEKQQQTDSEKAQAAQQAYDDAQIANERKRLSQDQSYQNAQLRGSGVDAQGNLIPLPPIAGQAVTPPPVNAKPEQMMAYYDALANRARDAFQKTGDPRYNTLATGYDTAGQKYAAGLYALSGVDLREQGTIPLDQARTFAERDLPARARTIAAGHDAAALQRATLQVNSREWIAKLNDSTRRDLASFNAQARYTIAQLAGAYHLRGIDEQTATQLGIADYRGQVQQYLQQERPYSSLDTVPQAPSAGFPTLNINVGGAGGGAIPAFPGGPGVPGTGGGLQPPAITTAPGTVGAADNQVIQSSIVSAKAAMAKGATPHQIRQRLNEAMQAGQITGAQRDQIVRQLGIMQQAAPPAVRQSQPLDQLHLPPINPQPAGGQASAAPFRFAAPQQQAEFTRTTPAMQSAAQVLGQFSPDVTSVMGGPHKGSAHGEGRAIDVGAFGGTSVGFNAPTWNAVMAAIASRRFQAIGTILDIVNNPVAQQWARANGVDLFEDDARTGATGNHVHFQTSS